MHRTRSSYCSFRGRCWAIGLAWACISVISVAHVKADRPLMRDFLGLNVHTVQFKPKLYAPVCRLLRDYHPVQWDIGDDASKMPAFPMAANGVDWNALYGTWTKAGFDVDACLMFNPISSDRWKDPQEYGQAFAKAFGPSSARPIVSSVEIGNEPAKYSAEQYREVFEKIAKGVRLGDSKLPIVTCAVMTGKTDQWSKPMSAIAGLESLYDVLNIHSYPFKDKWPTWRRSYPEDPSIRFLKDIGDLLAWRDAHAPGKPVWLTEFGYDSASKKPAPDGPWKQWVGVSDEEQARYIVRSFLVLSSIGIDRAYLYFFNDEDQPQLHGASGITRNFKPKPSFFAMSFLYKTLGEYRFAERIPQGEDDVYCYRYEKGGATKSSIYVAWIANGGNSSRRSVIKLDAKAEINRAEAMPYSDHGATPVQFRKTDPGIEIELSQTPVFLEK